MERDLFNVVFEDGTEQPMEVVSIFQLTGSDYNYIIYNELDKSRYYVAKYMGDDVVDLSTELNEEECSAALEVMNGVVESWS